MKDLTQLFTGQGQKPKAPFEVVLAKKGPFSGKPLKIAANDGFALSAFIERNTDKEKQKNC
jgi:hypothetical protein